MDTITTASGATFDTDYLSTIPNPQMTFFRVLNKTFVEVATVFSDTEETATLTYNNYTLTGCTLVAVAVEGDAVKVSMIYETLEVTE